MFSAFKILVTCLIISSRCTCIPIPNGETTTTHETTTCETTPSETTPRETTPCETTPRETTTPCETTTLTFKEKVEQELDPLKDDLEKVMVSVPPPLQVKLGVIQGKIEKIIERAVKNDQLSVIQELLKQHQQELLKQRQELLKQHQDKIQRVTIPLSVRNKVTKIENKHPEIKGTIPPEILKGMKPFEKPIIQRQYQWMELLNCNDDLYIRKLQADLKLDYSSKKSNGETYEEYKLNFCYAIATVIDEINKNLAHYEFEGMEPDLDLGFSDPVINPYIAVFYNSVVAKKKNKISS